MVILYGKAELPENGREARIIAERRHFPIPDKERDTMRHDVGRPVQRLERAILVPKRCINDRQAKGWSCAAAILPTAARRPAMT